MRDARRVRRAVAAPVVAVVLAVAAASVALGEDVVLRYHQGEGDKAHYDLSISSKARVDVQKGLTTGQAGMALKAKCLAEFAGATEAGNARVCGQVLSGSFDLTADGERVTIPIEESVVNYEIAPTGKLVLRRHLAGDLGIIPGIWAVFAPDDAFLLGGVAVLPDRPVKKGDTWKGDAQIPSLLDEAPDLVSYESTLLAFEQFRGRPCAKIRTTHTSTAEGAGPQCGGGELSVKAKVSGWVVWRFDYERGLVMSAESAHKLSVDAVSTHPAAGPQSAKITAQVDIRSSLTEYNGQKVPQK